MTLQQQALAGGVAFALLSYGCHVVLDKSMDAESTFAHMRLLVTLATVGRIGFGVVAVMCLVGIFTGGLDKSGRGK